MPTKSATTKTTAEKAVKPKKEKVKKETAHKPVASVLKKRKIAAGAEKPAEAAEHIKTAAAKEHQPKGRYIFATGRRKTAIANIRLFEGKGENILNKKKIAAYFGNVFLRQEIEKPFELTGLMDSYHFICHVSGGGLHSQVGAISHAIAIALSKASPDSHIILKKNGLLTRDDRKKERKKPGLKRARRSPQWAKR